MKVDKNMFISVEVNQKTNRNEFIKHELSKTQSMDKTISTFQVEAFKKHPENLVLRAIKRFFGVDRKMMQVKVKGESLYVRIEDVARKLHTDSKSLLELVKKSDADQLTQSILKRIKASEASDENSATPLSTQKDKAKNIVGTSKSTVSTARSNRPAKTKRSGETDRLTTAASAKKELSAAKSLEMAELILGKNKVKELIDNEPEKTKFKMKNTLVKIGREMNSRDLSKPFGMKPSKIHHKFIYISSTDIVSITRDDKTTIKLPVTEEFKLLKNIELSNELDNLNL